MEFSFFSFLTVFINFYISPLSIVEASSAVLTKVIVPEVVPPAIFTVKTFQSLLLLVKIKSYLKLTWIFFNFSRKIHPIYKRNINNKLTFIRRLIPVYRCTFNFMCCFREGYYRKKLRKLPILKMLTYFMFRFVRALFVR